MKIAGFSKKHKYFTALFALTAICALIYFFARVSCGFAEFFSHYIAGAFRFVLGAATSVFPFSLAEILVYLAIPALLFVIAYAISALVRKICGKKLRRGKRLFCVLLSLVFVIADLFVLTYGTSYSRKPLTQALEISEDAVSSDELSRALEKMVSEINLLVEGVDFDERGASDCAESYAELFSRVNGVFDDFAKDGVFFSRSGFDAKELIISPLMTYTHISGVFSFFTGESNINTNYPDYIVAFTTAHEYSHQRGVAPENEANLAAFLVLYESDEHYLRYCSLAYTIPQVASALYSADPEEYYRIMPSLSEKVFGEWSAYSEFFDKYRDNSAAKAADSVNDAYLKSQGMTEGTKSYGLFVDAVVKYLVK